MGLELVTLEAVQGWGGRSPGVSPQGGVKERAAGEQVGVLRGSWLLTSPRTKA